MRWESPRSAPLRSAYLNSKFETGIRSPLDVAILSPAAGRGWLPQVRRNSIRFRAAPAFHCCGADGDPRIERLLITKGAPEGILDLCESYETEWAAKPFDAARERTRRKTYRGIMRARIPSPRSGVSNRGCTRQFHDGRREFADPGRISGIRRSAAQTRRSRSRR